jgi:hypothetical protein
MSRVIGSRRDLGRRSARRAATRSRSRWSATEAPRAAANFLLSVI